MANIITVHFLALLWSYRIARSRDDQATTRGRSFRVAYEQTIGLDVEAE